jgi:hypothetical protein
MDIRKLPVTLKYYREITVMKYTKLVSFFFFFCLSRTVLYGVI